MRKKSEAQIMMEQVENIDAIIENKLIEQRQWHELALCITANMGGEKVQAQGSQSKMADAVGRCVDMEAEILVQVDKLVAKKKKATQAIERLYSPTEYKVLHMRYIQYKSLQDVADYYGRDYGWATTTHGRALKHLQVILEGEKHESNCV